MENESKFEVVPKREKIKKQIERLRRLKDGRESEAPPRAVPDASAVKAYKTGKSWWIKLVTELEYGVLPLFDDGAHQILVQKIIGFFDDYRGSDFNEKTEYSVIAKDIKKNDIERADRLIEEIILVLDKL